MKRTTSSLIALLLAALGLSCGGGAASTAVTELAPAPAPAPAPEAPLAPDLDGAAAASPDGDLDRDIPLDPTIRRGKLDNGLTYYVLENHKPEKRAQLWLAVNTGSVMEDDDQRGLAHFVEHMAFNGTARFHKMAIVNYLESIGMQFGPDVNAYTSFDETVYTLQVPTDDGAIVDKGLDILRDWAGDVTFEPEEVEKERGVVLEEWRLGRGAYMRIADKQYPVLFQGSRYADRLPIGKPEIIQHAPREVLTRFYRDWYRPDLMAIIAVGDFSADDIEARIKARFGDLKAPAQERPRPVVEVPSHPQTLVSIETDPEMPYTQVEITNKMPRRSERTLRDYRRAVAEELYHSMLDERFEEIRRRADSPLLWAWSSTGNQVRSTDGFVRGAMVKEGQVDRALPILFDEVMRVERHGFTAGELERARKDVLRSYRQMAREIDKRDSADVASEALRNFLEGETMPGRAVELQMVERFLPTITLDELNGLARAWGGEESRVILVSGPAKMKVPTAEQLLATARGTGGDVTAYSDKPVDAPLMAARPKPGTVTATRIIDELGVTEWTLSNGVRVVVKPTDFQNDEVLLRAYSPGGHSLVPDADFDSARFATEVVNDSGVGPFDALALHKLMAGKVAHLWMWVAELEEGLSGNASPEDLETLFQLIHLGFTAPRKDPVAFEVWRGREREEARNRRLSPERAFWEDLSSFISKGHLRRRPVDEAAIGRADLDKIMAIYQARFADAGDFVFVLVGNVDLDKTRALAEIYLGSLPAGGRVERWRDVGVGKPGGVQKKTYRGGTEPKSYVQLAFHGPQKWSRDAENDVDMLARVLDIRLREILREDMGGVYGVSAYGGVSRRPREERGFTVSFGCAPDNVDKLLAAVFTEIAAIQKRGIGEDYLAKVKATRRREREVAIKENWFWASELIDAYRYGDDPRLILDFDSYLAKVTSARVQAAARTYLAKKQYVLGVLRPAK